MKRWGSSDAVVAAIREEAQAERDRCEREAVADLAAARATAPAAVLPEAPLAAARRAAAEQEADEEWENARDAMRDREDWIRTVRSMGRDAIVGMDPQAAADWIERLVLRAAPHIPGSDCTVEVSPAIAALLDGTRREQMEKATGKRLRLEACGPPAGCVVRSPDGAIAFDNSIDALEQRASRAWRLALGRLYDAATTNVSRSAPLASTVKAAS